MSKLSILERLRVPTYDNEAYATTGRVTIDQDACNGCGMCASICPGKALLVTGSGKDRKVSMEADFPQCMSCNDCAAICKKGAIRVTRSYDFGYRFKPLARGALLPPRTFTAP